MKLTNENVRNITEDCLFSEDTTENREKAIIVEGIVRKFGFNPERIQEHLEDICSMLNELPDEFHEKKGGGWSFLNACNRKDGTQWTGLHADMESLLVLGIAAGLAKIQLPREIWSALPGGMPYFTIYDKSTKEA